jgi:3'-phosphoadenosine 5'-phosphosulfate sulfotransferase (PAPS reductase)/FAD synthetase
MEIVINFSGGKDSCAMLAHICEQYPNVKKHVVFADTGWEHTDAEAWARKIVETFGLELHVVRSKTKTFLTMAEARGKFPGMTTRQCTSDLKRDPIATWIRQNIKDPVVVSAMGLRASESTGRSKLKKLTRIKRETNSRRTVWQWLPIHSWTDAEVFAYLEARGIPLHPVYKHLRRFSCRLCIYMSDHDRRQVAEKDPEAIEIIARIEDKTGFTMFQEGPIRDLVK